MKKLITIATLLITLGVAHAQEFGGSLLYDLKTRNWSPVVSVQAFRLDTKLPVALEFRILGGIEEARGLVAGAVVASYPLAKQFYLELGGAFRMMPDRTPRFGLVLGASIKF